MLFFYQQHLLAVSCYKATFGFDDDNLARTGGYIEVWRVRRLTFWNCIYKFVFFILVGDVSFVEVSGQTFF